MKTSKLMALSLVLVIAGNTQAGLFSKTTKTVAAVPGQTVKAAGTAATEAVSAPANVAKAVAGQPGAKVEDKQANLHKGTVEAPHLSDNKATAIKNDIATLEAQLKLVESCLAHYDAQPDAQSAKASLEAKHNAVSSQINDLHSQLADEHAKHDIN